MDLPNGLTWLAIAFALFAIGLPNMSSSVTFQLLRGRKPQNPKEGLMARRFTVMIAASGYVGILIFPMNDYFSVSMTHWIER